MEAVNLILKRYPILKKKLERPNDPAITLFPEEAVFLQLVNFFKQPNVHQFSLNLVYEHLENQDLLFAIETIIVYFQKDTTLVQDVPQTFYNRELLNEKIVGQKKFAQKVEEAIPGMKFKPSMLHMYWRRGSDRVPRPDMIIDGTPYWKISSVKKFIVAEKKRRENKPKT